MQYPRVPEWVKDEMAWFIASDMQLRLVQIGGRFDDPSTWVQLAKTYGAEVDDYFKPFGVAGRHIRTYCTIAYNTARGLWSQCKSICHEIVRYLLWNWIPPQLRSGADGWHYYDDPMKVGHQIAQRVDGIMLG